MQVGSFGTIAFQCSASEVATFKDLSRTRSANFAEHAVLEKKAKLQFTGVSLEEMTFTVQLHAAFTDPEDRAYAFWAAQEAGEPRSMVIGNRNYGDFVLVDITETQKHHGKNGTAQYIELELTFREYN